MAMQVCGLSRIVIPAMFAGIIVSTLAQSEALGWAAALVVGLGVLAYLRITGRAAHCAVPALDHDTVHDPVDDPVGVTR